MSANKVVSDLIKSTGINVVIHDDTCYDDVFRNGSVGLGESYIEGKWDSKETLDSVFTKVGKSNLGKELSDKSWYVQLLLLLQWLYSYITWTVSNLGFLTSSQAISSSKVVADQHYNLDTRLYQNMLSKDMMYSCGYFTHEDSTLHEAQLAKLDLIARKLRFKPGMKVLDIGCGWGFACNYFNEKYGVNCTGITISKEQYNYAMKTYEKKGVSFILDDYRNLGTMATYDKIYSIGMFEHVTSKHYREFMEICNGLLKPGGLFLLHTIGSNTTKIVNDRFLEKYIFPNSMLPSLAQISQASEGLFLVEDVQNFGCHYDKTLMCWYHNFIDNQGNLIFLSDKFKRMWTYYLLSCAGTFRSKGCQLYQVVFSKQRYEHYERYQ